MAKGGDSDMVALQHRQDMQALEASIVAELEPYDFEAHTKHHFAHGTYTRELFLKAGTVIPGS